MTMLMLLFSVRGVENCLHDSNMDVISLALQVISQVQSTNTLLQCVDQSAIEARSRLMSVLCSKLMHGKSDAIGQTAASCARHLILVWVCMGGGGGERERDCVSSVCIVTAIKIIKIIRYFFQLESLT